jgi:hypothetical protein
MQPTSDIDPISVGPEELQKAARSYFDQKPKALAMWRAHQWMWDAATPEQIDAAAMKAFAEVEAAEHELPATLEKHNLDRLAIGMPPARHQRAHRTHPFAAYVCENPYPAAGRPAAPVAEFDAGGSYSVAA